MEKKNVNRKEYPQIKLTMIDQSAHVDNGQQQVEQGSQV